MNIFFVFFLTIMFLNNRHEADLNCVKAPLNEHEKSLSYYVKNEIFFIKFSILRPYTFDKFTALPGISIFKGFLD